MNFEQRRKEEMRLVLLRLLNDVGYRGNSSTLHKELIHWGLSFSRDQVKTELHWLKDQSCIEITGENADVIIVKLTTRGQDVAEGHQHIPGIQRPSA